MKELEVEKCKYEMVPFFPGKNNIITGSDFLKYIVFLIY